ncbi:MAG: lamin tail domain-containing protein [Caldilineaceae bacterium]
MDDNDGEWIEIANPGTSAVSLRGWTLADEGRDQRNVIEADLLVEPGAYVVLGRNGDPAQNGGVPLAYLYAGISLANSDDELLLYAPDGSLVDVVKWGAGTGLSTSRGASLYHSVSGDGRRLDHRVHRLAGVRRRWQP